MKIKHFLSFVAFILCNACLFAQEIPAKSNTLVTDYTNTLTRDEAQQLESKLVSFDDSTSTQIAVVILKSVGGYDIKQYADSLGRAWGIGQKDKNNGILILVALDDHKVAIRTGYGAEAAVTDIAANEIIKNDIIPNFKLGNYYDGLNAATEDLMNYMKGEYHQTNTAATNDGVNWWGIIITLAILALVILLILKNKGGGGGRQIIDSRGSASTFWWFSTSQIWSGSDSNSSDGSNSGDFGEFGGGDFGGGGSDGSW